MDYLINSNNKTTLPVLERVVFYYCYFSYNYIFIKGEDNIYFIKNIN